MFDNSTKSFQLGMQINNLFYVAAVLIMHLLSKSLSQFIVGIKEFAVPATNVENGK